MGEAGAPAHAKLGVPSPCAARRRHWNSAQSEIESVTDLPEAVVNESAGFLVNCSDETALCRAMNEVTQQTFDPQQIRENAARRFGYGPISQSLHSIYLAAIASQREVA